MQPLGTHKASIVFALLLMVCFAFSSSFVAKSSSLIYKASTLANVDEISEQQTYAEITPNGTWHYFIIKGDDGLVGVPAISPVGFTEKDSKIMAATLSLANTTEYWNETKCLNTSENCETVRVNKTTEMATFTEDSSSNLKFLAIKTNNWESGSFNPPLSACGALITANTVYTMTANASINSSTCMIVSADNVTLDCAGFSLTGNNADSTYGVYSNRTNTTIRNCNIRGFMTGIYFNGANRGRIDKTNASTISGSNPLPGGNGIILYGSSYNLISNSNASAPNIGGITLSTNSNFNTIANSTGISTGGGNSGSGIYIAGSSNNTIINSSGTSDGTYLNLDCFPGGIRLAGSSNNSIINSTGTITGVNNTFQSAGVYFMADSNFNIVTNVAGRQNSAAVYPTDMGAGIAVSTSSNNKFTNVTGTANSGTGISVARTVLISDNNSFTNCAGITREGVGIGIERSNSNNFTNCAGITGGATNHLSLGILLSTSSGNVLNNVTGSCNVYSGLYLFSSSNNIINNAQIRGIYSDTYSSWGSLMFYLDSVNNTITNSTINGLASSYAVRILYSSGNRFINNTISNATNLLYLDSWSGANKFYWNNFQNASGAYVTDANGSNFYNATTPNGTNEGNIYANVMNWSVNISGSVVSSGFPQLFIGNNGTGFPYSNSTSKNKFICSFANCADYAPLVNPPFAYPCSCGNLTMPNKVCSVVLDQVSGFACFVVAAQNVTIDCNGHSITGNNSEEIINSQYPHGYSAGVYSYQNSTNVRNCVIRDYGTGIRFMGVNNGSIDNTSSATTPGHPSTRGWGFYLVSSSYNRISNSNASSPSMGGITLFSNSNSNTIINSAGSTDIGENITFHYADDVTGSPGPAPGIGIDSSSNNTFVNSSAISRGYFTNNVAGNGVVLRDANYNTFINSTGNSVLGTGISLGGYAGRPYSGSNNNTFINSTGTTASARGITVWISSNNTFINSAGISTSTDANSGAGYGIQLDGTQSSPSSFNKFINSTGATNGGLYGIYISYSNYNTFNNVTAASNAYSGFVFSSFSSNNMITNSNIRGKNNGYTYVALYFIGSNSVNNTIANSTINGGAAAKAVHLTGSSNNWNSLINNIITNATSFIYNDGGPSLLIDCQGKSMTGTSASAISGYGIYSNQFNTTARNCGIGNFATGINFAGASYGAISNNNITVTSGKAIYINSGPVGNNNVSGNAAYASNGTGISLENTNANFFSNNYAESSGYAFSLGGSNNNSFTGDRAAAFGSSGVGFFITDSRTNRFVNITGASGSGTVMRLQQASDNNVVENLAASSTGNGTGIYVNDASGTNITGTGTNVTSNSGDAVYISPISSNTLLQNGSVSSVGGNGITVANGAKGTSISNMLAASSSKHGISVEGTQSSTSITGAQASSSSLSGAGIYLATTYANISGSSGTNTGAGYGLQVHGGVMLTVADSNFTSNGTSGIGAAAYFESASTDNKVYGNTFRSLSSNGDLLVLSESAFNIFYWNTFTNTTGFYAKGSGQNNFYNTTINGRGEGNLWYNVIDKEVSICGAFRPTKPDWNASGEYFLGADSTADPKQYPYNEANALGRLSGTIIDWAPLTTDRCWFPPVLALKNITQTCELKSCNASSDCMTGDAPYCDAGCNQLSHTCYPCVACENAYCLPTGQPCGASRAVSGCGAATCNAGVCTSSGETCPGAPGLSCCPSSYCSGSGSNSVCVPKKSAGAACTSASECAPSAPYCTGTPAVCKPCLPLNAADCTSNSECCPRANGAGLCNLAQGTAGANTCVEALPAGGKTCVSTADCASGSNLTCKDGVCAINHPPASPISLPVLSMSISNGTESITCTQNCVANNMPSDPDHDTPVRIEYRWVIDNTPTTGFWHNSPSFNCELLPGGCSAGMHIRIQSRACDKYGACSGITESAPVNITKAMGTVCGRVDAGCSLTQKCCSGMTCKYDNAGSQSGTCLIASPLLNCSSDSNCLSGLCRPNTQNTSVKVCTNALACGQSCDTSSQCPSGCSSCANGVCSACIPVNFACTSNSQCCAAQGAVSGLCSSGTCKLCASATASCTLDSECCSGRCQDSLDTNSKVCAPLLATSPLGGACLKDSDCATGFCDTLNRGSKIGVTTYGANRTTISDYGLCVIRYAPYTLCNISSPLPAGGCESPYSCVKLNGSNAYYCTHTNGSAGTQFSSWVKVGGVGLDISTVLHHSGASSALVSGDVGYAYNSALFGSLEGEQKYVLEFWAQTGVAGTLARYALYDTINNAYLNENGQWLYATTGSGVPDGGIIEPETSNTGNWKQVVKVFKTLPNSKLQLRIYPADGKTYYIDDVTVTSANDFSMLAWVRADAIQPGGILFSQMGTVASKPQGINWSLSPSNALTLGMYSSSKQGVSDSNQAIAPILPNVSLADGNWHQVALSVDRTGNYSVYLDGALSSQSQFTLGSLESSGALYIGGRGTGSGFSGELGEVRFYKRALTPADVLDHYNGWFQQQCKINLAFSYTGAAAQNLTAAYNADLRVRKLLPETILALPFDVNVSSDERGMIVDYSRFLGAGTKTSATWTQYGKVGGAYTFTGVNDRIILPSALVSGTGDFTLSAWIYPTGTTGYIMGNYAPVNNSGGIKLYIEQGVLKLSIQGAQVSGSSIPVGAWHHVSATRKAGVARLYIDGVLNATSATGLEGQIAGLRNFAIGNGPEYGTDHFQGTIDEVRVFSRALTDAEILSLYNDNALSASQALPLSQK